MVGLDVVRFRHVLESATRDIYGRIPPIDQFHDGTDFMGSLARTVLRRIGAGLVVACLFGSAGAQVPVFVKDLNTFPSHPRQVEELVVHDGRVYFHGETGNSSAELGSVSISDGSYRFERDLAPASLNAPMGSTGPLYYIKQESSDPFTRFWIQAHHGPGQEVWQGPEVLGERYWQPQSMTTVGSLAFFASMRDESFQAGLYVSDGTDDGTVRIHAAFHIYPYSLRVLDGKVLFIDMETNTRLWSVDPSTMKASPLLPDMGWPRIVWSGIVDGEYGIIAESGCSQVLVVRSGGRPENTRQQSFDMGQPCFGLSNHVVMHQGDAYIGGERILKLDFASGAVEQVAGPCPACYYHRLTSLGDTLVYANRPGSGEQTVLHRLVRVDDGHVSQPILHQGQPVPLLTSPDDHHSFSVLGDRILTNCVDGACTSRTADDSLELLGDELWAGPLATDTASDGSQWYFMGTSGLNAGIWRSDGRRLGTTLLHEIPSQTGSAFPYGPPASGAWVGDTMVRGHVNVCEYPWAACGRGIARSDGSAAGTWVVPDSLAGEGLSSLHNFGDRVLAYASTNVGSTLFTLSAELDDARVLAGPEPGMGTFVMTNADVDPDFALRNCRYSQSTSICAESAFGASAVRVLPDIACVFDFRALGAINGKALFWIRPCGAGSPWQLWSSAGTPQSTFSIPGVAPPDFTQPDQGSVRFGGHLYFSASVGDGWGLWRSNGNPGSAEQIAVTSGPVEKMASGALMYFQTLNGNQREIWRSDGTAQGTFFLQAVDGLIDFKVVGGDAHWISRENFRNTYWISDGSPAGTFPVPEHPAFEPAGEIFDLPEVLKADSPAGWSAVFACDSEAHGIELCGIRADGSGLALAADIAKGERSSGPVGFRTNGSKVFFIANDQRHGNELHELRSETIFRSDLEH